MIQRIKNFLIYPPTWYDLHIVGNSAFAKATITMPLVGYLILFNTNVVAYFDFSNSYMWHIGLSFPHKIFLVYFGLTSISIGSIVFHFSCPRTIKWSPSILDYVQKESDNINSTMRDFLLNEINSGYANFEKETGIQNSEFQQKLIEIANEGNLEDYQCRATVTRLYWASENIRLRKTRILSTLAYAIGFVLLAIPSFDSFVGVCLAFTAHLFS